MEFEQVIRKRESTRKFSDRKLEESKILQILESGRLAPTAKNIQPIKIYVVSSNEGLMKIDKATRCRYGAPVVILVCGDKDMAFSKNDYSTYEMDATIVATHLMLASTNIGVDNIWIEMFDEDVLRNEFDLPDNLKPVCLLPIGYKSELCPKSPMHNIRKKIDEIVEYK